MFAQNDSDTPNLTPSDSQPAPASGKPARKLSPVLKFIILFLVGLAVIVPVHIFVSVAIYHAYEAYKMSEDALRTIVPVYLVNDALPLILWLAFFPKVLSELFGFVTFGKRGGETAEAS